jgi:hypothetical protein
MDATIFSGNFKSKKVAHPKFNFFKSFKIHVGGFEKQLIKKGGPMVMEKKSKCEVCIRIDDGQQAIRKVEFSAQVS